ncbi:putative Exo-beta-1,3-glucanase [Teratosphaeria destructans]|uniref:Exo-beta-1,3-glucanase n=1 Tax=Teratosphaeria destructans TaxID=418781 RepID=A0A9W7SPR8_9PEZI|nr:putative Exo-beta-1,3-glucanase [Teratosphaeria destructans]
MRSTTGVWALFCGAASVVAAAPHSGKRGASGFDWSSEIIRGVNLGGWLVLEPWITPSIFQPYPLSEGIVDEYTLNQKLGNQTAHDTILKPHWDSWVQLADMQKIANAGFNLVRIPVGFWAYDTFGYPYAMGAAPYIDLAIGWARQVGLKVIIDLHGAPLSQNGFDNSGQRLDRPGWTQGDSVRQTLQVLQTLQDKYGDASYDDVVAAIELLNEPLISELEGGLDATKQFWRDGYSQQRTSSSSRVVLIQDGFNPPSSYNGFLTPSDHASNVALDHHEYQCFSDELVALQPWQHRQLVCNNAHTWAGADKWEVIGEWSAAMTDCAPALNGYGIGARYDGTYPGSTYVGSCATKNFIEQWDQDMRDNTRGYIEAQMEVFEHYSNGWIFWNFKTQASAEWDAFRLIDAGIFPQPLSSRQFGAICEF